MLICETLQFTLTHVIQMGFYPLVLQKVSGIFLLPTTYSRLGLAFFEPAKHAAEKNVKWRRSTSAK